MKGRHWLLESDLKEGLTLRLDKSSRSILIILRQLGRIHEVGLQESDKMTGEGGGGRPNRAGHLGRIHGAGARAEPDHPTVIEYLEGALRVL